MNTSKRTYGKLREIIERHGGTMVCQKQGNQWGAWEISLNGKGKMIKATGARTFPELDNLFVPAVENPKTWDDYTDELLADAEQRLLSMLT